MVCVLYNHKSYWTLSEQPEVSQRQTLDAKDHMYVPLPHQMLLIHVSSYFLPSSHLNLLNTCFLLEKLGLWNSCVTNPCIEGHPHILGDKRPANTCH